MGKTPQSPVAGSRPVLPTDSKVEEDRLNKLLQDYEATWDGLNDPQDPYNWPTFRKTTIGIVFSLGQLITLMSASMIAAALGDISRDLNTSASTAQIIMSTYFLGLGLGPFLVSALAEMYGRKPVWILGNVWYIIWNACSPVGKSTGVMIFGRLMTGAGASVGITLTGPVMADMYRAQNRGKSLAIASVLPYLGPAFGPIVGGLVTITILGVVCIRESYTPVLLRRKAAMQQSSLHTTGASPWALQSWKGVSRQLSTNLQRPLRLLLTRPIIQFISLVLAINFGTYCLMLSTFASLWIDRYHQSKFHSSLHYISIAIGSTIAGQASGLLMDVVYRILSKRNGGVGRPEFRIAYMVPGLIIMPAGLVWYGWLAEHTISWIMVDFGPAIFTLGSFMVSQAMYAYQLDEFAEYGASANAASRLLSYTMAFVFPIFAPQLYSALGYGWGNSLLAVIFTVLSVPIAAVLWFWGPKIRALGDRQKQSRAEEGS